MDLAVPSLDGFCHFFQLPAETRNQVYNYILSDEVRAVCREGPHDGSGMFRFYPHAIADRNLASKLIGNKGRNHDNSEDETFYESSKENNLDTVSEKGITSSIVLLEINQLKHVCRRLDLETKTVVIRNNDLIFERDAYPLGRFLNAMPTSTNQYLRKVIVLENRKWKCRSSCFYFLEKLWRNIIKYCQICPTFTTHVYLSWLNPNYIFMLLSTGSISLCTRRPITINTSRSAALKDFKDFRYTIRSWVRSEIRNPNVSSNIRVFPPYIDGEIYGFTQGDCPHPCSQPTGIGLEIIQHVVKNGV